MPVEIRELIIRAVTTQNDGDGEELSTAANRLRSIESDDKQAIIDECVRQVMRILQQKKER